MISKLISYTAYLMLFASLISAVTPVKLMDQLVYNTTSSGSSLVKFVVGYKIVAPMKQVGHLMIPSLDGLDVIPVLLSLFIIWLLIKFGLVLNNINKFLLFIVLFFFSWIGFKAFGQWLFFSGASGLGVSEVVARSLLMGGGDSVCVSSWCFNVFWFNLIGLLSLSYSLLRLVL